MRVLASLSLALLAAACGDDGGSSTPPTPDAPPTTPPVLAFSHTFPDAMVRAGQEQVGLCRSVAMGNEGEMQVNLVTMTQSEALRASSWYAVPEAMFAGPDGEWPCAERGFTGEAALAGGGALVYRQSVDVRSENQQFGEGAAIRVPAHARLIGEIHRLNRTAATVTGHTTIELHGIDNATAFLRPVLVAYQGLELPPHTRTRFSGTCQVSIDRIHYAQPNARDLSTRVFATVVGGPRDGQLLVDLPGPIPGVAAGIGMSPPMDLTAATGIAFGCEYDNPRDAYVHFGLGDQEMCDVLAFVEADASAVGIINSANASGTSGDLMLFTGGCVVTP